MAKKISFDTLPSAVERILEILSSEGSENTALPELADRIMLIEKKIDYLQRAVVPEASMMDMHDVCRALKLRPKAVSELARTGVLISREQGKKTVYYEDSVVKYFMSGAAWKEATASKSPSEQPARKEPSIDEPDGRRRVDINAAGEITDRNAAALYQLIKNGKVPYYKDGRKVYFFSDELRAWAEANPARKYKKRSK